MTSASLEGILGQFDHLLVAFSGGVDSTCLLAAAVRTLGHQRVAALTATSPTLPAHELAACRELAARIGVTLHLRESGEMARADFIHNGPDRCYHCKSALFDVCNALIAGLPEPHRWAIAYGANQDDLGDHRPGMMAAGERGIHAPLLAAGMGKEAIRALSRELGLPTADKPAFACLSSRFPTHTVITLERLARVEGAEEVLRRHGFRQYRVRYHGRTARIEVGADEVERLTEPLLQACIVGEVRQKGFDQVEIVPEGYRTGAANLL